jgi:hypothetical protein
VSSSKVPPQLRMAKRHRHQRPLFESLSFLDIRLLGRRNMFPPNWHGENIYENVGFIFPGIKRLTITRGNITAIFYGGKEQILPIIKWFKPGLGGYRPVSQCLCGKTAFKFYITRNSLRCKSCAGGVYASQACDSKARPALQSIRLKAYLDSARGLHSHTKHRLQATQKALQQRLPHGHVWHSRRIPDRALRPRQRYRHHGSLNIC